MGLEVGGNVGLCDVGGVGAGVEASPCWQNNMAMKGNGVSDTPDTEEDDVKGQYSYTPVQRAGAIVGLLT